MPDAPRCLIVGDKGLIALSLEAFLEGAGFRIAGSFGTGEEALRWLEQQHPPDVALLDLRLKKPCLDLVRALRERSTPVVIYSGLPGGPSLPSELEGVHWIEKPAPRETLLHALEAATRQNLGRAA